MRESWRKERNKKRRKGRAGLKTAVWVMTWYVKYVKGIVGGGN